MNIKSRLEKLEKTSLTGGKGVYCVDKTAEGTYKLTLNGIEREFTEEEFEKFQDSRNGGIFIIDDILKWVD